MTPLVRIDSEEIFGPVMAVMSWPAPTIVMIHDLPQTSVGSENTAMTWQRLRNSDFSIAMRRAVSVSKPATCGSAPPAEWVGAPYGGWKQSGIGKEESFEELLSYTRVKNVNLRW